MNRLLDKEDGSPRYARDDEVRNITTKYVIARSVSDAAIHNDGRYVTTHAIQSRKKDGSPRYVRDDEIGNCYN